MSRHFLYYILIVVSITIGVGCTNISSGSGESQISVNTYLDNMLSKLTENSSIRKVVIIQGNKETAEIDRKELEEDLEFYRKIDISGRSYKGKYDVDTIRNENTITIVYEAAAKGMEVKNQEFVYNSDGILLRISAVREFNSVVSDFVQKIDIYPDSLLRINQNQNVTGRGNQTLVIEHHL